MARLRILAGFALAFILAGAPTARAQCPYQQPNPWNGDEPVEFSHHVDSDGDGLCDGVAAQVQGAYPNGLYPACEISAGVAQVAHGHWEYTHLHHESELSSSASEEKDYLDSSKPPAEMADQTLRFAANEPVRFFRALSPSDNPSGNYWQVDQWIGPGGVPLLTWSERFFECSAPENCASVGGKPAAGGYWGSQPGDFGYPAAGGCGDALSAAGPRSACCGMFFPLP